LRAPAVGNTLISNAGDGSAKRGDAAGTPAASLLSLAAAATFDVAQHVVGRMRGPLRHQRLAGLLCLGMVSAQRHVLEQMGLKFGLLRIAACTGRNLGQVGVVPHQKELARANTWSPVVEAPGTPRYAHVLFLNLMLGRSTMLRSVR